MEAQLRRLARESGVADLVDVLAERLSPSDLNSLLLAVYARQAARRSPAALLADFAANRYVRPAAVAPERLRAWDDAAFAALPEGFTALELSPLCPLATSSAVATVHQDKAVTTGRGVEVLSDPTNVLALECALRRRTLLRAAPRSTESVKLAASHRVVRPSLSPNPVHLPHFRLFGLCTAGRNTEGTRLALVALTEHLGANLRGLRAFVRPDIRLAVAITDLTDLTDGPLLGDGSLDPLRAAFPDVAFGLDPTRTSGRGYYRSVCFKLHALDGDETLEIGDGGDVDWTAKLLSDRRERCFISGLGSDRIATLGS